MGVSRWTRLPRYSSSLLLLMRLLCDTLLGHVRRPTSDERAVPHLTWGQLRQRLEDLDLGWSRVAADAGLTRLGPWLPLIGDTWPELQPGFVLTVEPSLGAVLLAEAGVDPRDGSAS